MPSESLTITESGSGTLLEFPISNHTIPATLFTKFNIVPTCPPPTDESDRVPIRLYDSGFKNTTVCRSAISHVDGDHGKLYYRGYDIEELVEKSNFLEVAYLLIYGSLPSKQQYDNWVYNVMHHTYLHAELERQMLTFRYDSHPMGMVIATIASLSTFHPEANPALQDVGMYLKPKVDPKESPSPETLEQIRKTEDVRNRAIYRMLGKVPTIAANAYRHRLGRSYNHPKPGCLNYCENILYMMDKLNETDYTPDPRLVKILDKLFIILAENGANCSTVMMRHFASSGVDPYTALSGSAGALFGERKSSAVIDMLKKIGSPENIQSFLETVKTSSSARKESIVSKSDAAPKRGGQVRLMGFGHRIYKTIDPRAKICKKLVFELFELMGKDKIAEIAIELEERALADPYFTSRHLYPNVDYWLGLAFHILSFPPDMFPVWMLMPRTAGLIAHTLECLDDPEYKIFRPRQIYVGEALRKYEGLSPVDSNDDAIQYMHSNDPRIERRRGANRDGSDVEELQRVQKALEEMNLSLEKVEKAINNTSPSDANVLSSPLGTIPLGEIGSRLKSWLKSGNQSEDVSSRLNLFREELALLQRKQHDLLDRMEQLRKQQHKDVPGNLTSGTASGEPVMHARSGSPLLQQVASESTPASSAPDLLAGSKTPRVIASPPVKATPIPARGKKATAQTITSHPADDIDALLLSSQELSNLIKFANQNGYDFREDTIPVDKIKNKGIVQKLKAAVNCARSAVRGVKITLRVLQYLEKNPNVKQEVLDTIQRIRQNVKDLVTSKKGVEKAVYGIEIGKNVLCLVQLGLKQMGQK